MEGEEGGRRAKGRGGRERGVEGVVGEGGSGPGVADGRFKVDDLRCLGTTDAAFS